MDNRLLVIDDEVEFAAFVRRVGEGSGYEVRCTSHVDEFRQWIAQWRPTHIVLDLAMPEADGVEVLRELAGELSTARIVIVSGFDTRVLEAARRLGLERGLNIVGALPKPVRARELRAVLDRNRIATVTADTVRQALDDGRIFPVFQPKVRLDTLAPTGFEALARWKPNGGDLILPECFVPVAETGGVIDLLSTRILTQAIGHVRRWSDAGLQTHMAINLSGRNLHDESLADRIDGMCRTMQVPRENITLEITETAAMADAVRGLDILTRLRLKGFKLSIDDFGTGYSSMVQLLRLPFSELKIDRSFVKDCHVSAEALTIVRAVIELAHNLSMSVVAEGVDDPRIVEILAGLGCDSAQGYAISRPLPAEDVPGWMSRWRTTG
jgi:FOG: EAL domain